MKAAVITLHSVANYGTQLQALATQEKLKQYFDEVIFIDYRRPDTYGKGLLQTFTKGNMLKAPFILPTLFYWKKIFGNFQKEYLNLTKEKYLNDKDFENFNDCADIYFSGSDQVCNTGWNKGVIPFFYLSFVPNNKPKYAYASSFGKDKLSQKEIDKSKKYLKQYSAISVREQSGVDILKNQYKINNAIQIIDPTLALAPDFWRKIAPKSKIKEKYILIYNLNRSKEFDEYAQELSKKTGLKLYRFCTRFDQILRNGKSLVIPQVLDFITLIDNATYVLTDSFHATAFSMNMNTEPICVYPKEYSKRISDFLELVQSSERHIKDYNDFDILNKHVDFAKVNKILDEERKKVDKFLQEIVSLQESGNVNEE